MKKNLEKKISLRPRKFEQYYNIVLSCKLHKAIYHLLIAENYTNGGSSKEDIQDQLKQSVATELQAEDTSKENSHGSNEKRK